MPANAEATLTPEIAHILFLDVVGYSKLLVNEQVDLLNQLNQVVRETTCVRVAEVSGKLIRLPTGDGVILLFFDNPEEPVRCAAEISEALRQYPHIRIRIGAHSGPVNQTQDVNGQRSVVGTGINIAQRIVDCGDAGHILLSKRLADDLAEYSHWRPYLTDLGECTVKHGVKVHLVNFVRGRIGNPKCPEKLRDAAGQRAPLGRPGKRVGAAAALLAASAVVTVAIFIFVSRHHSDLPSKSVAVLPFESLSDARGDAFFAYGMQGEILRDLVKIADLKVIGQPSVAKYPNIAGLDLMQVANTLGVRYLLKGNVQRSGDRIRVQAQLIDATTNVQVWVEHYDRQLSDVFAIQSEIAEKIAAQLQARLTPEEKAAIEVRPTDDIQAYESYVNANAIIDRVIYDANRIETLWDAERLLGQATARDPRFFLAFCRLAFVHDQLYFNSLDHTTSRLALAKTALGQAKQLRPDVGEVHLAAAAHYYFGYLDYDNARQELTATRAQLPNDPYPILLLGYIDRRQGYWDRSTQSLELALSLDPRNLLFLKQLALSYTMLRRYPDVIRIFDRAIVVAPDDPTFIVQRAAIELDWHANTGPLHAAIDLILARDPSKSALFADLWMYLALCEKDFQAADQALEAMTENGCHQEGLPYPQSWCQGLVAREKNDDSAARRAFTEARLQVEHLIHDQPNFAAGISVLGMIDAALGNKDDALAEGRKAVALLPVNKDAITGPVLLQNLAVIYSWTGEDTLAINELQKVITMPSYLSYGELSLYPNWDALRKDARFKTVMQSLPN